MYVCIYLYVSEYVCIYVYVLSPSVINMLVDMLLGMNKNKFIYMHIDGYVFIHFMFIYT
jgi:hypothetical protein